MSLSKDERKRDALRSQIADERTGVIERTDAAIDRASMRISGYSVAQRAALEDSGCFPVGRKLKVFTRDQERRFIIETIRHNGGDREKSAKMLGISVPTLYRKLPAKFRAAIDAAMEGEG